MFISTANDINDVPLTLQDRLEIINLEGYSTVRFIYLYISNMKIIIK